MIKAFAAVLAIALSTGALAQQPAPGPQSAPFQPKRGADFISGMLFLCSPLFGDDVWTHDVCKTLTEEAVSLAKANDILLGVLVPSPDRDQPAKLSRATGFDPTHALTVDLRFVRSGKDLELSLRARGRAKPLPGDNGVPRTSLFSTSARFKAGVSAAETEKSGRAVLKSLFDFYTMPIKMN